MTMSRKETGSKDEILNLYDNNALQNSKKK